MVPHIVADNYFSGEHVMDYLRKKGYGMTTTCRQDCIPKVIKPYIHHEKVTNYDLKAKVMRFQNPIVAVKQIPALENNNAYTKTFVSFQSTGPTNIAGVKIYQAVSCMSARRKGEGKRTSWFGESNRMKDVKPT